MPILKRMEKASTDSDDRPTDPIVVVGCGVLAEGEAAGYVDLVGKAAQEAAGPAGVDPGFDLSMLKGGAKMLFRAQLFWQEVRTVQCCAVSVCAGRALSSRVMHAPHDPVAGTPQPRLRGLSPGLILPPFNSFYPHFTPILPHLTPFNPT